MLKILKNTTGGVLNLDVGVTVNANDQITLSPETYSDAADNDELVELIAAGTLIVNDGNQDLTKAQGIALIQAGFVKSDLVDTLKDNDRIKVDVTGTLGDGKVKASPTDTTANFLQNKLASADNKLALTIANATNDEDLIITLNSSNINTSELNNNANFITSAEAPIQPSDIANFENTTELNVRDVNNRNRSNHTGTQTASTISDFTAAVQTAETTTTLSFNNTTKILSYTNENGSTTDVDLTQFLDDTNLARITTGVLDPITGIATFTRDDNTTFTIDFSSLNDQSAINSAISTHEQTINNHNDVDTTTITPSTGSVLTYDGSNWVPKATSFKDFAKTESGLINQLNTFEEYLSLPTTVPETGFYKISYTYRWSINTTGNDFIARVQVDNSTTIHEHQQEVQDSAGIGVTLPNTEGGNTNSSSNQRFTTTGFDVVNLTAGAHTIDLDFRGEVFDIEPAIYKAIITIEKWEEN